MDAIRIAQEMDYDLRGKVIKHDPPARFVPRIVHTNAMDLNPLHPNRKER